MIETKDNRVTMFNDKNRHQMQAHGLSETEVQRQIDIFKKGIPFAHIVEAASIENGILVLSEKEQQYFAHLYDSERENLELLKFIPASGAATRMFQFLHQFLETYNPLENIDHFLEKKENKELKRFFSSLDKFAFYDAVIEHLKAKIANYEKREKGEKFLLFVSEMLGKNGLNYENTPKGLVPFHKHKSEFITAFGAHLNETAFYAAVNGEANLHFTVSEEHKSKFKKRHAKIQDFVEKRTNTKFIISYSFQKKETDTIAVTPENELFLDENGNMLFRPSGHGALLENLNDVHADIIFIKNIDNVVSQKYVETIAFHKKVLAGKLISLQNKIFELIDRLQAQFPTEETVEEAFQFIVTDLYILDISKDKDSILKILNRPIRVCGVVENTGAPGGGPFFVKNHFGNISLQIVEMSQIDLDNPEQKAQVDRATHFNPVDLVCGTRDYKGQKFNLPEFADPNTGFISEKSYKGTRIKALERPGLWNGAMANWNTIFVEVPLITFNPVKTVNDLLNNVHQS